MKNFYDYIGNAIADDSNIWGFHIIVDAEGCDKSTVESTTTLEAFIKKMVEVLGLLPIGSPVSYTFNDGNGRGSSCLQLIDLSHLSSHTDAYKMSAYCDFFSCGKYSKYVVNKAINLVDEFFNPKNKKIKILLRSANKIVEIDA